MKGRNPLWDNLPRRKCDDCGKSYKPKQPLRPGFRGFCTDNCRKSYHKHGGAYRKLRGEMAKLLTRHLQAVNEANQTELRILVKNEFGRINAELKELRQLWIETEARYVALAVQLNPTPTGHPHKRRQIAEAISKSLSPSPEESTDAPPPNR